MEVRAWRGGRPPHRDPRRPAAARGGLAAAWGGLCVAGVGPAGTGPERRAGRRVAGTGAAPSPLRAGLVALGVGGGGSPRGAPARAGSALGLAGSAVLARVCAGWARRKFGRFRAAAVPGRRGRLQAGPGRGERRRAGGPPAERPAWASAPHGPRAALLPSRPGAAAVFRLGSPWVAAAGGCPGTPSVAGGASERQFILGEAAVCFSSEGLHGFEALLLLLERSIATIRSAARLDRGRGKRGQSAGWDM